MEDLPGSDSGNYPLKDRSRTARIASVLSTTAFLWLFISLCTPHWLESDGRIYSSKFDKMGIWTFCFRSFSDPKRRYPQHFVSCRWFFDSHWKYMYDVLAPPFFVIVQLTFGTGFILTILCAALLATFWARNHPKRETLILYALSFFHMASAFWFVLSCTVFGSNAHRSDWLPGWQNNYLSWSYALAIIGGIQLFVASILYYVEAKRFRKRSSKRSRSSHLSQDNNPTIRRLSLDAMHLLTESEVLDNNQVPLKPSPAVITTVSRQSMV